MSTIGTLHDNLVSKIQDEAANPVVNPFLVDCQSNTVQSIASLDFIDSIKPTVKTIYVRGGTAITSPVALTNKITKLVLPDTIISIQESISGVNLKEVVLPSLIDRMPNNAIQSDSLSKIYAPAENMGMVYSLYPNINTTINCPELPVYRKSGTFITKIDLPPGFPALYFNTSLNVPVIKNVLTDPHFVTSLKKLVIMHSLINTQCLVGCDNLETLLLPAYKQSELPVLTFLTNLKYVAVNKDCSETIDLEPYLPAGCVLNKINEF